MSKGRDAFAEAVFAAWRRSPYLASALFALVPVPVTGLGTTASDQYYRCYYDPDQEWEPKVYATLLLHEVGHILFRHFSRFHAKDKNIANEATDLSMNPQLIKEGGRFFDKIKLPNGKIITQVRGRKIGPLLPKEFGFDDGLTAEEYYELMQQYHKDHKKDSGDGDDGDMLMPGSGRCGSCATGQAEKYELPAPGMGSDGKEIPGVSPLEAADIEEKVAKAIEEHGKQAGTVAAMWQRFAEMRRVQPVNWQRQLPAVLRQSMEMSRNGQANHSYQHPSRRQSLTNVRLPALVRPKVNIGILLDTSGSIDDAMLGEALSHVDDVIRSQGVTDVKVICNDVGVGKVQKVSSAKRVNLEGNGGTDLRNGITAFNTMRSGKPHVVIVLTDAESPWETPEPKGMTVIIVLLRNYSGVLPKWSSRNPIVIQTQPQRKVA